MTCNSKEELIKLLSDLKRESEEMGLLLNVKKTKIMVVDENGVTRELFKLDDDELEEVNSFVYLGSTIDLKGDSTEEIKRRIGMAKCTTMKMESIWKRKVVSTRVKLRLIDTIVFPVMSYGSESRGLKKTDERKISVF